MRTARWAAAALLLAAAASGSEIASTIPRPVVSGADRALCRGLDQADARLRVALAEGSLFIEQVYNAFVGQGSGEVTARGYVDLGRRLFPQVAAASAQCVAAFGSRASQMSEAEAAAIRRRAQSAKRRADLYWDLPRTIDAIDANPDSEDPALRARFLAAMYAIADGENFDEAGRLADAAHAARRRIRR